MRRRWLIGLLAIAFGLAGLSVLAWGDHCGPWPDRAPWVRAAGRDEGALRAGAAAVALAPHFPVTVAGYPPLRPTATSSAAPLMARATVVEVGRSRVSLVELDTLLVTARMQRAVQEGQRGPVWLLAAHAHSSLGGYDHRPVAELAALGRYDELDEALLIDAARAALTQAHDALEPARLEVASLDVEGLNVPRSGDEVERRLTVVRFLGVAPVAQWVIFSAHPTLASPQAAQLDPDWPGRLAGPGTSPVTLVLQGAGGNASVDRSAATTPEAFAAKLLDQVVAAVGQPVTPRLEWAEVGLALPRPDGSRLAPGPLARPMENLLCWGQEREAMVSLLRLGAVSFLFTTLEPSAVAGRGLKSLAEVDRVLGLANGYHGYLEPEAVAQASQGESKRQYFGPHLSELVGRAAALAKEAAAHAPLTAGPDTPR